MKRDEWLIVVVPFGLLDSEVTTEHTFIARHPGAAAWLKRELDKGGAHRVRVKDPGQWQIQREPNRIQRNQRSGGMALPYKEEIKEEGKDGTANS